MDPNQLLLYDLDAHWLLQRYFNWSKGQYSRQYLVMISSQRVVYKDKRKTTRKYCSIALYRFFLGVLTEKNLPFSWDNTDILQIKLYFFTNRVNAEEIAYNLDQHCFNILVHSSMKTLLHIMGSFQIQSQRVYLKSSGMEGLSLNMNVFMTSYQ